MKSAFQDGYLAAAPARVLSEEDLRARHAMIEAIALLDMAIAGTTFTKPRTGQIIINVVRAEKVLTELRAALAVLSAPAKEE